MPVGAPLVRGREAVLGPQLNVCADCRQMVLQVGSLNIYIEWITDWLNMTELLSR